MSRSTSFTRSARVRAAVLLGGGAAAGIVVATALGASAESSSSTAPSTPAGASASGAPSGAPSGHGGNGGANETQVTGTKASTLKAAALKKVPGATVDSVSTEDPNNPNGAAYEVNLTKSDGTHVTVLFDSSLAYKATETGHGGGRGGHGGPGNGETTVTGAKAATLRAAALQHVPGATVDEVSTDSGDAAYEVHLTKSDGTQVTVKFDKDLTYTAVESGRGK